MRIVLGIIGSVMTLIVLATAAVVFFVDPNQWREPISDALSEQTGRPVAIDGSLNWQFFPRLGIDVGAVRIGSGAGFGDCVLYTSEPTRRRGKSYAAFCLKKKKTTYHISHLPLVHTQTL